MKYLAAPLASLTVALLLLLPAGAADADKAAGGHALSHDVYFTLKERTPEAKQKLVEACKKYLSGHEGCEAFSAGVVAEDLSAPVNDRDFDVAVHILFKDKAAHDTYQKSDRHKKFIEENRDGWAKVRVFDSYVEAGGGRK
jgi:hypothetical protein